MALEVLHLNRSESPEARTSGGGVSQLNFLPKDGNLDMFIHEVDGSEVATCLPGVGGKTRLPRSMQAVLIGYSDDWIRFSNICN